MLRNFTQVNAGAPWQQQQAGQERRPSTSRQQVPIRRPYDRNLEEGHYGHEEDRYDHEEEENSTVPDDVLKYGNICILHALRQTDTLPVVALMYGTTSAVIRDVNNLKQVDLDCLAGGSFLVIPLRDEMDLIQQCYSLNQKPDFLEKYGSRLPPAFRQIRKAPSSAPPPNRTATATNWDDFNEPHLANDPPVVQRIPRSTTGRGSSGSSIGSVVSRGIRSIFLRNGHNKGKYRN